jgi:inner membrane protein
MPTIFTHPAVVIAASPWFRRLPKHALVLGTICASLPDVDVLGFALRIPYGAMLGHRGFTHSIVFAAGLAALVTSALTRRATALVSRPATFLFFFLVTMSHGLLDAATNGGRGVGFFIPFSARRFFLPWQPIQVSPIGASRFALRGLPVVMSELRWVWAPALVVFVAGLLVRRMAAVKSGSDG